MLSDIQTLLSIISLHPTTTVILLATTTSAITAGYLIGRRIVMKSDLDGFQQAITDGLDKSFQRWADTLDKSTNTFNQAILQAHKDIRTEISHVRESTDKAHERIDCVEGALYQLKGEHTAFHGKPPCA